MALRDLAVHATHAVCVDGRGDVYQWGDGFFGQEDGDHASEGTPVLTLRGKVRSDLFRHAFLLVVFADPFFQNINKVQVTESRVFALSASGKVYVIPARVADVARAQSIDAPWWSTGWLWGEETGSQNNHAEIVPAQKLAWGER